MRASAESKTFCFDIDGTLCTNTHGDYANALPFTERISHVNRLYAQGHTIKLFTARGATTVMDWLEVTRIQISEWGLMHHELIMGKTHADYFVDDKAIHSDDYN